jgi:hypothetical protein
MKYTIIASEWPLTPLVPTAHFFALALVSTSVPPSITGHSANGVNRLRLTRCDRVLRYGWDGVLRSTDFFRVLSQLNN